MKTEIQKLRAELERERNAADLVARDSDTYRRERDALRAEVERLTKAMHDASQVSPTERDGIECHISSMLSNVEQEREEPA